MDPVDLFHLQDPLDQQDQQDLRDQLHPQDPVDLFHLQDPQDPLDQQDQEDLVDRVVRQRPFGHVALLIQRLKQGLVRVVHQHPIDWLCSFQRCRGGYVGLRRRS